MIFCELKLIRNYTTNNTKITFKKETMYQLCSQTLHSKIAKVELYNIYTNKLVSGETRLCMTIVYSSVLISIEF